MPNDTQFAVQTINDEWKVSRIDLHVQVVLPQLMKNWRPFIPSGTIDNLYFAGPTRLAGQPDPWQIVKLWHIRGCQPWSLSLRGFGGDKRLIYHAA